MRGNTAAQDIPVLIVHPEVGEVGYGSRKLSPVARQVLLNEWGLEALLPSEKIKLDDSVVQLFLYASSMEEQLLIHVFTDAKEGRPAEEDSLFVKRCIELSSEQADFVLGVPIAALAELLRCDRIIRIRAA